MRVRPLKPGAAIAAVLVLVLLGGAAFAEVAEPPAVQTLCILDFTRLGDDTSLDWLRYGLADMMIATMNRLGPFQVIERAHLRDILHEHGLAASGLVDTSTAVRQARLARAHLLLLGSFARQGERLTLQVRLMRLQDQQIVAQATWTAPYTEVLTAPRALSQALLNNLAAPFDPAQLDGIERHIPTTIDVARAYYTGLEAFDAGRYPEALAHYRDAAQAAGRFGKAYTAVLEMYELLGQSQHAVLFARRLARTFAAQGDVSNALAYYFAAAQHSLEPLQHLQRAIDLLERLLRLVQQHERQTGEMARTKRFILDRLAELDATGTYASFGQLLAHRSIRYRMWPGDLEAELRRRAEERARGGYMAFEDGRWLKRPVPEPSVFMWSTRARRTLARLYARLGRIRAALDHYERLLEAYRFLARHARYDGRIRDAIRTEAHFMILRHYAETGRLIRDHALNAINRLNIVHDGFVFRRDFADPGPDSRARVASRHADRGHEFFDFAAPAGYQIDAVALRVKVAGLASFGVSLPHAAGWPPQFSLSRRLERFKFRRRGTYERTVALPAGMAFVSISTVWGPGLYANTPAEVLHYRLFGPRNGPDIVRWQATFAVSRRQGREGQAGPDPGAVPDRATRRLVEPYAAGWDDALVVRQTVPYTGDPTQDGTARDWLVYALDGDLRLVHRGNPQFAIDLPRTINTREAEFDASLLSTHDGRYALLWARGTSRHSARRFVAISDDLRRWETPQRLGFEAVTGDIGYTYGRSEPPERTYNVVPMRRGYAMLLAQGLMRYSDDLRHWSRPHQVLPQQLHRNRLVATRDGTVWAVYENPSEALQPYTSDDRLHGYFVVDGKRYRRGTELRVSRSADGRRWQAAGMVVLPGQPSGLWAFPVSPRRLGIAVAFNNRFVQWFTVSRFGDLRRVDTALQVMHEPRQAECFVRDAALVCLRAGFDAEQQQPVLVATRSRALYEKLSK